MIKGSTAQQEGGLNIHVSRSSGNSKKTADDTDTRSEAEQKLARLFEQLGGGGRIKIHRINEKGENFYTQSMAVDSSTYETLEEKLGALVGGGRWLLKAWLKDKNIGCVEINVDPRTYPEKFSEAEIKRLGDAAKPPETNIEARLALMQLQNVQAAAQAQAQTFATILQMQEQSSLRQLELVKALHGGAAAAPPGSPQAAIASMVDYAKLFKALGWGQHSASPESTLPPALQMLSGPLNSLASAFGEKVGSAVARKVSPQPQTLTILPAASATPSAPPTPISAAPPPTAEEKGPAADQIKRPPPGVAVQMPPGVRLFKPGAVRSHKSAPIVQDAAPEALAPKK